MGHGMSDLFDEFGIDPTSPAPKGDLLDEFGIKPPPGKQPGAVSSTLKAGVRSLGRSLSATADTYRGDEQGVIDTQAAQRADSARAPELEQFHADLARNKADDPEDAGLWEGVKNVGGAIIDNPKGAALGVVEQAPNAVPVMAAGWAGMKAGAAAGAALGTAVPVLGTLGVGAAGAVLGGLAGMFLGNTALETGHKAMQAADDGSFGADEQAQVQREGAIKGGVITAIDGLTLGLGGKVASAMQRTGTTAVEAATRKVLVDNGIDVADEAAVLAARSNPEISAAVRAAQENAVKVTDTFKRRATEAGTLLGLETVGEGMGEYLGELAATGEADVTDAVLEAAMSLSQSGVEAAWNMSRTRDKRNLWEPAAQVQPQATPENPAPTPVPRPDPNAGPLSAAASRLPAPTPALGLPAPDTLYVDSAGQASQAGPTINVDGQLQRAAQAQQWVNPQNNPLQNGGPGMEQSVPRGEPAEDARVVEAAPVVNGGMTPAPGATEAGAPVLDTAAIERQLGPLQDSTSPAPQAAAPAPVAATQQDDAEQLRTDMAALNRQAKVSGWTPAMIAQRTRLQGDLARLAPPASAAASAPLTTAPAESVATAPPAAQVPADDGAVPAAGTDVPSPAGQAQPSVMPVPSEAAPAFTTLKTVRGDSVTVRTSDLNGPRTLLTQYTPAGKLKEGSPPIHRGNLDPAGEQRAAAAADEAEVVTTRDGHAFASKIAAGREMNKRGLQDTHEVVPAAEIHPDVKGYVVRRKARPQASAEQAGAKPAKRERQRDEPPIELPESAYDEPDAAPPAPRENGPFGPILREFRHDAQGAIAKLTELQAGEAVAALHHPEVGDIDLVWGKEGDARNSHKGGYGLAKIVSKHPEVLPRLQELVERARIKERDATWVTLEDDAGKAIIRLDWNGEEKHWLVSAYEKRAGSDKTSDTAAIADRGDTALTETSPAPTIAQPPSQPAAPTNTKDAIRAIRKNKTREAEAARADYFTPGNIVASYGGNFDRVLRYNPADAEGHWSVTVRAVEKQGDQWVDRADQRERTHMTQPEARELKAGPVLRAEAQAPAARTLNEDGSASDGKAILPGDTFRTQSGRMTSPFPKQKGEKYASQWLIDNAIAEAEARGDQFNGRTFRATTMLKGGQLTEGDRAGMTLYLFMPQPAVPKPLLKPLVQPQADALSDERLQLASRHKKIDKTLDLMDDAQIEALFVRAGLAGKGASIEQKRQMLREEHPDDIEPLLQAPARPKAEVSANTIFTDEAAEDARALIRSMLGQLNSGVDPRLFQAGITLAGYHIEKGARTFAAFAKAMLADMGDSVKPYLKQWYMGVKYDPRASALEGMSSASEVDAFNLDDLQDEQAAQAFIRTPEGELDFGEITEDMARAAGRQAGKIRLQQGDERFGLAHIEARHGEQIRSLGYDSVQQFVHAALERPDALWKPDATTQLVVLEQGGKGKAVFVQLQAAKDDAGDYYTVNTAFPVSDSYAQKKKGWKELWSREAVPAAASGERAPFAEPDRDAGDQATMPSGQSTPSIAQAGDSAGAATRQSFDAQSGVGEIVAMKTRYREGEYGVSWASTDIATTSSMDEAVAIARAVAESGAQTIGEMREVAKAFAKPKTPKASSTAATSYAERVRALAAGFPGNYAGRPLAPLASAIAEHAITHNRRLTDAESEALAEQFNVPVEVVDQLSGQPFSYDGIKGDAERGDAGAKALRQKAGGAPSSAATISDVGEQLKFNKKGMFRGGGLTWADIATENDALKVKLAGKEKIWARPNWEQIVNDHPEDAREAFTMVAYLVKQVYDSLPKQAPDTSDAGLKRYIEAVTRLRNETEALLSDPVRVQAVVTGLAESAAKRLSGNYSLLDALKRETKQANQPLFAAMFPEQAAGGRFTRGTPANDLAGALGGNKALKAMQWSTEDAVAAIKARKAGWPAKQEAWQKRGLAVLLLDSEPAVRTNNGNHGALASLSLAGRHMTLLGPFDSEAQAREAGEARARELVGQFVVLDKGKRLLGAFLTEGEALSFARAQVARRSSSNEESAEQEEDGGEWQRVGEPRRENNRDISADELMQAFGFRGVNFGNWVTQRERQQHLNATYDGFMDLADLLGLPPRAMSLNGLLGVALGAQGGGQYSAHFVPGLNEINLTKTRGAGALAHEWAHALDHYLGTLAGLSRRDDPFASTLQIRTQGHELREEVRDAILALTRQMRSRMTTPEEELAERQAGLASAKERVGAEVERLRPQLQGHAEALAALDAIQAGDVGEYVNLPIPKGKRKPIGAIPARIKTVFDALGYDAYRANDKAYTLMGVYLAREALQNKLAVRSVHTQFYKNSLSKESKSGKPYWTTPWEMFARSFESWVMDKLAAKGASNTYLVAARKADKGEADSAYPSGMERETINQAISTLAAELKYREDAESGQVALYSLNEDTQSAYAARIDALFAGAEPSNTAGARVLDRSDVLAMLGYGDREVVLAEKHAVSDGRFNHPQFSADDWKKVPQWLENPVAVFERDDGHLTVIAPETKNGRPIIIGLNPDVELGSAKSSPRPRFHVLLSAYNKDKGRLPLERMIRDGQLRYLDQRKTPDFNRDAGHQLPSQAADLRGLGRKVYTGADLFKYRSSRPDGARLRLEAPRQKGIALISAKGIAKKLRDSLGLRVEAVADESQLPEAVRQQIERDGVRGRVAGVYHEGTAYLIASNLHDSHHALRVALHEAVGHAGVKAVLGQRLSAAMRGIYAGMPAAVRRDLEARYAGQLAGLPPAEQEQIVAEEYVAHLAEHDPRNGLLDRLVALVKQVIRELFGAQAAGKWTRAEVVQLLAQAKRAAGGNGPRGGGQRYRSAAQADAVAELPQVEEASEAEFAASLQGSGAEAAFARAIYKARGTDSPFFRRWFGKSRMVDKAGRPVAFVHRSFGERDSFRDSDLGANTGTPTAALGHFLSRQDVGNVERYGAHAERFYIRMEQPKVITQDQFEAMGDWSLEQVKAYRARLQAQSHDGLYIQGLGWAVAFTGQQIKALRNAGTFEDSERARYGLVQDAEAFRREVERAMAVPGRIDRQLTVGRTPEVLRALGAPDLPISISKDTILKASNGVKHDVQLDDIKRLPELLADPVMVFDSRTEAGALVVLIEVNDASGRPVVVAIHTHQRARHMEVNKVNSVHGRESGRHITGWIKDGLLRYRHMQKSREWFQSRGLQLPREGITRGLDAGDRPQSRGLQLPKEAGRQSPDAKVLTDADIFKGDSSPDIRYSLNDSALSGLDRRAFTTRASGLLSDLKPAMLGALPLNYLREFAPRSMEALNRYIEQKRQMDADRNELHTRYDQTAQRWLKLRWTNKAAEQSLADLMHAATLAGIDPSKAHKDGQDKATYDRLRAQYEALPAEHRAMFAEARDAYRDQIKLMEGVIEDNIRKSATFAKRRAARARDKAIAEAREELDGTELEEAIEAADKRYASAVVAAEKGGSAKLLLMRKRFEQMRVEEPYFPLKRFGDYFVALRDGNKLVSFSMFENAAAMNAAAEDLRKSYPELDVKVGRQSVKQELDGAVDPGFVSEVQELVAKLEGGPELADGIYQLYLNTLPDYSMRKGFIHRKKMPGFNRDALRAFSSSMFHSSYQIARLKHALEMNDLVEQVEEQANAASDPVDAVTISNELRKRHEWVMAPKGGALAQRITSAAFVYQLGATPAAAFVNTTQTFMLGIPVLGARFKSEGGATRALLRASGDFLKGHGHIEKALSGDEARAFAEFMRLGLIDKTQAHDLAGVGETGVEYNPLRHKVMGYISAMFHHAERYNREVTSMAAYRLAREAGMEHAAAVREAADLTWQVHFDYSSGNRARYMQSDTAKVLLVFRQHSVNMLARLTSDLRSAMKGETPQVKAEAKRRLAGMFALYALFAGALGVPGAQALLLLLNGLDDDDDPWTAEDKIKRAVTESLGEDLAAVFFNGLPGTLSGVALTERIGMGSLWFRNPNRELEGRDAYYYWMEQVLGAAPAMVGNAFIGASMIGEGEWYRGFEAAMPKAVKDLMRAGRYSAEGVQTLSGDMLVEELQGWEVLAQALGFTPAHLAEQYERNGSLKNAEQHILQQRRQLLNRHALAVRAADEEARQALREDMQAFNQRYPQVAITGVSLMQSMRARAQRDQRTDGGLALDKRLEWLRDER